MLHPRLLILSALVSLAACTGSAGPCSIQDTDPIPSADACHATALQRFVGRSMTAEVMDALATRAGARNLRTIRPGDAVTMDFRAERLNVELDADGRIARLRCG